MSSGWELCESSPVLRIERVLEYSRGIEWSIERWPKRNMFWTNVCLLDLTANDIECDSHMVSQIALVFDFGYKMETWTPETMLGFSADFKNDFAVHQILVGYVNVWKPEMSGRDPRATVWGVCCPGSHHRALGLGSGRGCRVATLMLSSK